MKIKTYEDEDIVEVDRPANHKFEFITDIPGDNPDLFPDFDNHMMEERLRQRKVIDKEMETDVESCCFYIYFQTRESGRRFIKNLNTYVLKKAELIEKAREY